MNIVVFINNIMTDFSSSDTVYELSAYSIESLQCSTSPTLSPHKVYVQYGPAVSQLVMVETHDETEVSGVFLM